MMAHQKSSPSASKRASRASIAAEPSRRTSTTTRRLGSHNDLADHVKGRLRKKGENAFHKLRKMFLGAIEKLDEDAFKQALLDSQSLVDGGYLDLNKPIKTSTGSTFLHTSVWFRKLELVKFLLAHGAKPNAQNVKGYAPLHYACENAEKPKARDIITLLLRAGADPHLKTNVTPKVTPMDKIPSQFKSWLVDMIAEIERLKENMGDLTDARVREQLVREWDKKRSTPPTSRPQTPAHKNPRLVKKGGAIFNQLKKLFGGRKKMDFVAIKGLLDDSIELLRNGYLDLDSDTNANSQRLLHTAVWYQRKDVVECLLKHGASPNVPNVKGSTPLHVAVEAAGKSADGKAIVSLLLDAGGDRDVANFFDGRTPAQMAANKDISEFVLAWTPKQADAPKKASKIEQLLQASSREKTGAVVSDALAPQSTQLNTIINASLDADNKLRNELDKQRSAQDNDWMAKLNRKHASVEDKPAGEAEKEIARLLNELDATDRAEKQSKSAADDDFMARLQKRIKSAADNSSDESANAQLNRLMDDVVAAQKVAHESKSEADADFLRRLQQRRKDDGGASSGGGGDGNDGNAAEELLRAVLEEHDTFESKRQQQQQQQDDDFLSRLRGKKKQKQTNLRETLKIDHMFDLLDREGSGIVSTASVHTVHTQLHHCTCPMFLVRNAIATITQGAVTRENYLPVLQAVQYACNKYTQVYWDVLCMDTRGIGVLPYRTGSERTVADFLWHCNMDPVHMSTYLPNRQPPPARVKHYVAQRTQAHPARNPLLDDYVRLEELISQLVC